MEYRHITPSPEVQHRQRAAILRHFPPGFELRAFGRSTAVAIDMTRAITDSSSYPDDYTTEVEKRIFLGILSIKAAEEQLSGERESFGTGAGLTWGERRSSRLKQQRLEIIIVNQERLTERRMQGAEKDPELLKKLNLAKSDAEKAADYL